MNLSPVSFLCYQIKYPTTCIKSHINQKVNLYQRCLNMPYGSRNSRRWLLHFPPHDHKIEEEYGDRQPPALLLVDTARQPRCLPYRVDCEEQHCDHGGQEQDADDDRIGIAMDALEHGLSHLSSDCTGSSCAASFVGCCDTSLRRRGQLSCTRPIWVNRMVMATPVTYRTHRHALPAERACYRL